jgi:hypothetical protein
MATWTWPEYSTGSQLMRSVAPESEINEESNLLNHAHLAHLLYGKPKKLLEDNHLSALTILSYDQKIKSIVGSLANLKESKGANRRPGVPQAGHGDF